MFYPHPLPTLRDVKRHFICNADRLIFADLLIRQIIGSTENHRRILFLFDFALFDKLFFFCTNAFQQHRSRLVIGVLRDKFSLHCHLQNGIFQLLSCHFFFLIYMAQSCASRSMPRISVIWARIRSMSAFRLARFS